MFSVQDKNFSKLIEGTLSEYLGFELISKSISTPSAKFEIKPHHLAPNGFLHAASIIMLADSLCGYGCIMNLPEGAQNFATVELKSNHIGTARHGIIECKAEAIHLGKNTQIWDASVFSGDKRIAVFRCTQMILWKKLDKIV